MSFLEFAYVMMRVIPNAFKLIIVYEIMKARSVGKTLAVWPVDEGFRERVRKGHPKHVRNSKPFVLSVEKFFIVERVE